MDFAALPTIIGIIILLGALGLLKPLRNLTAGLGDDVEVVNDVKTMAVQEWHANSKLNHAKQINKIMVKAQDLETVHTYADVMAQLKHKRDED